MVDLEVVFERVFDRYVQWLVADSYRTIIPVFGSSTTTSTHAVPILREQRSPAALAHLPDPFEGGVFDDGSLITAPSGVVPIFPESQTPSRP